MNIRLGCIAVARRVWEWRGRQKQEKALTTWQINQLVAVFYLAHSFSFDAISTAQPLISENSASPSIVWTVYMYSTSQTKFTRTAYLYSISIRGVHFNSHFHSREKYAKPNRERATASKGSIEEKLKCEREKKIQFIRCVRRVVRRLSRRFHLTCFQSDRYIYLHTFMP